MANKLFECPYCKDKYLSSKSRKPRRYGKYKVKYSENDHSLILQCMRCSGVFRLGMRGSPILWNDFNEAERKKYWNKHKGGIDDE